MRVLFPTRLSANSRSVCSRAAHACAPLKACLFEKKNTDEKERERGREKGLKSNTAHRGFVEADPRKKLRNHCVTRACYTRVHANEYRRGARRSRSSVFAFNELRVFHEWDETHAESGVRACGGWTCSINAMAVNAPFDADRGLPLCTRYET